MQSRLQKDFLLRWPHSYLGLAWPELGVGEGGVHTNALQSLCVVVKTVAAVARVAWGGVHTHSALAHLVLEELALIHICRKTWREMRPGRGGDDLGETRGVRDGQSRQKIAMAPRR